MAQGKLVANGVVLEKHEMATVVFFLERGYDIELIRPSLTPGSRNADFYMNGLVWEMKSPEVAKPQRLAVLLRKASKQSRNIIVDLRRLRQYTAALRTIERIARGSRSIDNLLAITKQEELLCVRGTNLH